MAQRMIMKRMPSSIKEKAQISIDPNAMGVKMKRKKRTNFIVLLSIILQHDRITFF
jgi:hypothetical protein